MVSAGPSYCRWHYLCFPVRVQEGPLSDMPVGEYLPESLIPSLLGCCLSSASSSSSTENSPFELCSLLFESIYDWNKYSCRYGMSFEGCITLGFSVIFWWRFASASVTFFWWTSCSFDFPRCSGKSIQSIKQINMTEIIPCEVYGFLLKLLLWGTER